MAMAPFSEPRLVVKIQPQKGQFFLYKSERARPMGSLVGEGSSKDNKCYPTIEIENLNGQSAIVVVSCVSKDSPYHVHPHNLVGENCKDGICTLKIKAPFNSAVLSKVTIEQCKRQEVKASLDLRLSSRVDPFGQGLNPAEKIDLTAVRLCFQAFLPDADKKYTTVLNPVVSNEIFNKKTELALTITRLSASSGKITGNEDMIILCEKVHKDDIQVRFFEQSPYGEVLWESNVIINPMDVHHQYAISFKTPPYHTSDVNHAVSVFVQLYRPSNGDRSDPTPFTYRPLDPDPDGFLGKRKKVNAHNFSSYCNTLLLPSTLETVDDEDNDGKGAGARPSRRTKRGSLGGSAASRRTATSTVTSQNPAASYSAASLPAYSYDDIGVSNLPDNKWSFVASTSSRFPQDDSSQYLLQPSGASTNVVYALGGNYNLMDPDDLVAGEGGFHPSLMDQLVCYPEEMGIGFPTSAELLQQLGNGDQLMEVPSGHFNIVNSQDAAAAAEQLMQEISIAEQLMQNLPINPPNS